MTGLGDRHRLDGFVARAFQPVRNEWAPRGDRRLVVEEVSGSCTNPVSVRKERFVDREYHVRCRRCPGCLRSRQSLWKLRAEAETLLAPQTVLFTGTFRSQTHDPEVCKEATTRWLKRCRYYLSKYEEDVRYLVIPERHKSGAWHIHGLLHSDRSVDKRLYRECWSDGFTEAAYCDWNGAGYVTKYVAKNMLDDAEAKVPRVRASRSPTYGAWIMERDKEKVRELLQQQPEKMDLEVWKSNLTHLIRDLKAQEMTSREELIAKSMKAAMSSPTTNT